MNTTNNDLSGIYNAILGKAAIYEAIAQKSYMVDAETAKNIVQGELENFMTRISTYLADPKNSVAQISIQQAVSIFLEVMQSGLSFSVIANHLYISRMKGTGMAIGYKVTADGAIYQAQRAGAISHMSEPVLVLKGESFTIRNTPDGKHVADHIATFDGRPQFNMDLFLVGYVYIVYPNGDRELSWVSAERMKQLQTKSASPSNYNDESFVQTKIINHALRKVRKTAFTNQHQSDDEDLQSPIPQYAPTMIVSPPNYQQSGNGEPF